MNELSLNRTVESAQSTPVAPWSTHILSALRSHWPEYLLEGLELGLFMISACVFVVLLEYPGSPVHQALPDPTLRRVLIGIAMGRTAISIIYSPWGQWSGAHFNSAVTLTFLRLGKVERWDAVFYILAQFVGGVAGVYVSALLLGKPHCHSFSAVCCDRPWHEWCWPRFSR
jgi:aquaporin Z